MEAGKAEDFGQFKGVLNGAATLSISSGLLILA